MPSAVKSVPYARVKDIEFHKRIRDTTKPCSKTIPRPSQEELSDFFLKLQSSSSKPAILSLVHPFSNSFVPKSLDPDLPCVLSTIFRPELIDESYHEILKASMGELERLTVTSAQKKAVEEKTRGQANSKIWFQMRTGRVTASRFKAACHTDPACPSASLIMSICHPELSRFSTDATRWGCNHEGTAKNAYLELQKNHHHNFTITDSGLHIHSVHGFLGASPDAMVHCQCCGLGVCEIKVTNFLKFVIFYAK